MSASLDNIVRIESREQMHELVATGEPFITRGVLAGTFLSAVDDRAAVLATFGTATLAPRNRPALTVAEYFAASEVGPGSLTATLPPELEARLTELARRPPLECAEPGSVVWLGRAGCKQRFHADMDCAGIFLAQAMGAKRVCLVSPMQTQKLQPGLERDMLLSEVPFQVLDDVERARFLAYVDGKDTVLGPGETLFIPPLWWHFVEYVSDSLAISWHSPPNPQLAGARDVWALLWKHEWPLWQGIVSRLGSDRMLAASHAARLDALVARLASNDPTAIDALRALHGELCVDRYVRSLVPGDTAFFERRGERPLPWKPDAWRPDDVPCTQPYLRFALSRSGNTVALVVLDGTRLVAELALDDDTEALADIALAVGTAGDRDVATLADELECDVDDLCAALAQLSVRGWVTTPRSA